MYTYAINIQELRGIRIGRTKYYYSANSESIKIFTKEDLDKDLELKYQFKGNYIGKKCCFRIDKKSRFKFMGEAKPPKDPIKKIFWEHGFTESRRKKIIDAIQGDSITAHESTDIKPIFKYNEKKEWWADEEISLDKAKELMESYEENIKEDK